MRPRFPQIPLPIAAWIVVCAFFNCAGWLLSCFHALNRAGYAAIIALGIVATVVLRKNAAQLTLAGFKPEKLKRRFRRPFAFGFLVLATLTILGGAIYAPNNYDGLAYRLPRILNWLAESKWHWVHTEFQRLNTRTAGIEWLWTPLIAFTRSDRLLFLVNAVSFLLLPGLVFSVFTRVGVRPRAASRWMWILPTGYCYLLQAGSIANDMFGAVFALASVDLALRARESSRVSDAALSMLSAALLTAAKASNVTLLLPWFILMLPIWRIWLVRPVAFFATAIASAGASFLPTAVLNYRNCGDWTGLAAEHALIGGGPAWLHLLNNSITYLLENLVPPVFPFASAWNHLADQIIPPSMAALLAKSFEPGAAHWRLGEVQIEEGAGLGFGVTILLFASVIAAISMRRRVSSPTIRRDSLIRLACVGAWISLLYSMAKFGLAGAVRYLAPYYPLLMMGLLVGAAHALLVKRRWWRAWVYFSYLLALMLLIISPSRPLWPAHWFVGQYEARLQASALGSRALNVYSAYADRAEAFAPALKLVPADAKVLGVITRDDPETSLWKPFGSRRVFHVLAAEPADEIRKRGIKYVLVKVALIQEPWETWLQRVDARVLDSIELKLRAGEPPSLWRLVEINPAH